jgi:hypothetical protein
VSRPPNARPDRVPEHLKWTRVSVECKKTIKGWIAGPVFGCEGHGTPAFKPCHALFTGGARECPWCRIPKLAAVKYQGYLPMYDDRLKRTVLCVNLDVTAQCDTLALLSPIEVGKGQYSTSPLFLKGGTPWTELKPSGPRIRTTPQDLVPWLVNVLWKAEGLQEYGDVVARPETVVETPVPPSPVVTEKDKSAREALHKKMMERGFKKSALFFAAEEEPSQPPSKNGKHPKPPG